MSIPGVDRRQFVKASAFGLASTVAAAGSGSIARANHSSSRLDANETPESVVKLLFESLTDDQKKQVCFDWDHRDPNRGLLRTRVANNWHITRPAIASEFFTGGQKEMIRDIFEGIIQPEWHEKVDQQLTDDSGGFGIDQNIAIFGEPGSGKFEFVLTGRHITLRCDGNSADHVAFGGPIFYGHAAGDFDEEPHHPGNVYWEQALAANKVYAMLSGTQRKMAEVARTPREQSVAFQGKDGKFSGIPVAEMSGDQQEEMQRVLMKLLEPYRKSDQDEVVQCLKAQGGLEQCHLAFYTDDDLGNDKRFDNWRLEGPSFVWFFRGAPHVHVWVNIADSNEVELNAG